MKRKYVEDIEKALRGYPFLRLKKENGKYNVIGEIELFGLNRQKFDEYSVSIYFPRLYPYCFPKVIEVSGKIPRKDNRHVNSDATLCLVVEPQEKALARKGITFDYFIQKILIPHLSRETYREQEGNYPDGEFSHGGSGVLEYLMEELNINSKTELILELQKVLDSNWPERNHRCECGSGLKFKKCHLPRWNKVMKSGKPYLKGIVTKLKFGIK